MQISDLVQDQIFKPPRTGVIIDIKHRILKPRLTIYVVCWNEDPQPYEYREWEIKRWNHEYAKKGRSCSPN